MFRVHRPHPNSSLAKVMTQNTIITVVEAHTQSYRAALKQEAVEEKAWESFL
jgi:hypothetical protein